MLLRWMRARYPTHPISETAAKSVSMNAWHAHDEVTDVFLRLARQQHQQGVMDPDVQVGLGILFYTNAEYDRSQDCFESALAARPKVSGSFCI